VSAGRCDSLVGLGLSLGSSGAATSIAEGWQTVVMETMRLRRARFFGVLLSTSLVVGLLYGVLLVVFGQPAALLTWWGTLLRAAFAVLIVLGITGAIDRRWSSR